MKKKLVSPLVVALPKSTGQFTVDLDAEDIQLYRNSFHKQ